MRRPLLADLRYNDHGICRSSRLLRSYDHVSTQLPYAILAAAVSLHEAIVGGICKNSLDCPSGGNRADADNYYGNPPYASYTGGASGQ